MNKSEQTLFHTTPIGAEGLRIWLYEATESSPWRAVIEYRQETLEFLSVLELVKYLEDLQYKVRQLKGIR